MTKEQDVLNFLKDNEPNMIKLLEQLVNCDSGSHDKKGVDACGDILIAFFKEHGIETSIDDDKTYGKVIRAHLPHKESNDQRPVMLMGHRDTVFTKGDAKKRPFTIVDGKGMGPGVVDMKSGLVSNAFALVALKTFEAHTSPVLNLITSDEEIASPHSRKIIEREAMEARCCFNSEPSKLNGTDAKTQVINSGRKGGAFMRLEVKGVAAHSGNSYEKGRSAVLDIAHKTKKLMGLTEVEKGVTINVGVIGGGTTMNTVAPHAFIEFDLRYVKPKQRDKTMKKIVEICEKPHVKGTTSTFIIKGEFYPLVLNQDALDMQKVYSDAAGELGMKVTTSFSGGCADSGFTSMVGCPTICSVGPSGGDWHTENEYVEIASILPACQALALSVMRVARA